MCFIRSVYVYQCNCSGCIDTSECIGFERDFGREIDEFKVSNGSRRLKVDKNTSEVLWVVIMVLSQIQ